MKRLLSSLLALVMIFCCFSSAASAAVDPAKKVWRIQAKVGSTNISNSTGGLISTYYVLTKAQEGHIAPRDYTGVSGHKCGAVSDVWAGGAIFLWLERTTLR